MAVLHTDELPPRFLRWLLAMRALMAVMALWVAITQPFFRMVAGLISMGVIAAVAESVFAAVVMSTLAAERRAAKEAARRRLEAEQIARREKLRAAQRESAEKYFELGQRVAGMSPPDAA